jgi:hypothetical protein
MRMDQPSADESRLPETSPEQPGARAVLLRRLERLPQGHPSSLATDTRGNEISGAKATDGIEQMAGSRARFFDTLADSAGDPAATIAEADQRIAKLASGVEDAHGQYEGDARRRAEAGDGALQHADADPLRALGSALETHPGEYQLAMETLDAAGVDVDQRPGSMSYSPSAVAGEPGRLILDREASYGALVHEMSHFADDEAAGFPGLRYWLEDPAITAAGEERAYQAEIDYANSIGETAIADRLAELRDQRISQLRGEGNE